MSHIRTLIVAVIAILALAEAHRVLAADAAGIEKTAAEALKKLYARQATAEMVSEKAKAILVFPNVFKAGFLGGAHYGEGVLF